MLTSLWVVCARCRLQAPIAAHGRLRQFLEAGSQEGRQVIETIQSTSPASTAIETPPRPAEALRVSFSSHHVLRRADPNDYCPERGWGTPPFCGFLFEKSKGSWSSYTLPLRFTADSVLVGTDSSQGKGQIISNINACLAVQDTIKPTLGPYGGDLLMVDANGRQTITNDGATVMKVRVPSGRERSEQDLTLGSFWTLSTRPPGSSSTSRGRKMRKWETVQPRWLSWPARS